MQSFELRKLNMNRSQEPLLIHADGESSISKQSSQPTDSVRSDQTLPLPNKDPRGARSPSPRRAATEQSTKPARSGRRERVTWGGVEDSQRSQDSVRSQPVRITGGRGHGLEGYLDQSRSPRHHQEYLPSDAMYVLYEEAPDRRRGSTRTSTRTSLSQSPMQFDEYHSDISEGHFNDYQRQETRNTFIGEIDGRFSFSEGPADDYVRVERISTDGSSTSQELHECKQTVLKPYLFFLKLIGWRRIRESHQDLNRNVFNQCCNVVYPMIIFFMLAVTTVSQLLTCYFRDMPAYFASGNESWVVVNCTNNIVVTEVIPGALILSSYIYGVYIFRYGEPEHLAALMETVFLSHNQQMSARKKKNIIVVLRMFLVFGVLWILYDVSLNIMRLFSLQLLDSNTYINLLLSPVGREINSTSVHSAGEDVLRYFFVLFALLGFLFFDLFYFAVVITYVSQSQLIQYYIVSIIDKVRAKAYGLDDAIKEIRHTYDYLQVLNTKLAILTSLVLFIFLGALLSSIYNLVKYPAEDYHRNKPVFILGIFVGVANIFQWSVLAGAPLIQAARLTSYCRRLRRLGLEIGSRPFVYADTPQLLVDSFVQYTNATRYTAKLASVPVYPSYVVGLVFLGGIIGTFVVSTVPQFSFARWF